MDQETASATVPASAPTKIDEWLETNLAEVGALLRRVSLGDAERLGRMALEARRVYVFGQGRSGLVMRMFAMRLMQIGLQAHVVGDVTTPAIQTGDLLVASSGSGETAGTVSMARHARELGAGTVAITTRPDSTLAGLADHVLVMPGQSIKMDLAQSSRLPLANALEQSLLILTDCVVAWLAGMLGENNATMMARHANLE